jgi:hypothetical protein
VSLRREREPVVPSSTDLFGWIDALYSKKMPDGTPPTYMMHRFLASDRDLADVARVLQLELREPMLIFKTWQALLPKGRAPRFNYIAAKKPPAEEELVTKMRSVLSEKRETVETMIEMVRLSGRLDELYIEFGIKDPDAAPKERPRVQKTEEEAPPPRPRSGLLR